MFSLACIFFARRFPVTKDNYTLICSLLRCPFRVYLPALYAHLVPCPDLFYGNCSGLQSEPVKIAVPAGGKPRVGCCIELSGMQNR